MSCAVRVSAFAKINLSLRVLGVRPDGYHELRTIFQSIALHDTLTVRARRGPFALQCDDPDCPTGGANLVWQAAEHVWAASGRRGIVRDVEIQLTKRIPLQAGLGGGSSDAAAALRRVRWRSGASKSRRCARSPSSSGRTCRIFWMAGRRLASIAAMSCTRSSIILPRG